MGVYLPNVDMPKDDKVVTIQICPDGSIWQQYRGTVPNVKAVPVPPHGRLIDADALEALFWDGQCYFTENIKYKIKNIETIIPAEEGEA